MPKIIYEEERTAKNVKNKLTSQELITFLFGKDNDEAQSE